MFITRKLTNTELAKYLFLFFRSIMGYFLIDLQGVNSLCRVMTSVIH